MSLRGRDRIALGVVLILALFGAYYLLVLKPEQKQVSALDSQIATQQQTLTTAQQSYAQGRAAMKSLNSDGPEWAALRLAVPEQSDVPALLRTLQKTAATVHVSMQAITVTNPSVSSTAAPAATGATPGASAAAAVPIQLSFTGGYRALNNLVHRLTGLVEVSGGKVHASGPLLSLSNVSLSGSAPKLTVQLTASLYQLSDGTSASGTTTGGQP
jgi:Tfp pilus assembly protein PilO